LGIIDCISLPSSKNQQIGSFDSKIIHKVHVRSMGTKGGIVLYHIGYGGYGTTLGCHVISGVTCCQPRCWLINIGWVTKPSCDRICGTCTPTKIVSVLIAKDGREVMSSSFNNHFNLSSTKGQLLTSCLAYWEYA
jgi:hypothetical protein